MVKKATITKNVLTFEYLTPLAGTDCKTVAKVGHFIFYSDQFALYGIFCCYDSHDDRCLIFVI